MQHLHTQSGEAIMSTNDAKRWATLSISNGWNRFISLEWTRLCTGGGLLQQISGN